MRWEILFHVLFSSGNCTKSVFILPDMFVRILQRSHVGLHIYFGVLFCYAFNFFNDYRNIQIILFIVMCFSDL